MGKWLPKIYDKLMAPMEKRMFRSIRNSLVGQAQGQVLEIGSGTGLNFPYYTSKTDKVTAIEPDITMREQSLKRAQEASLVIDVQEADAERLPFPDDSFDTVIGTLVLCTIPDPDKALAEIRRVCKSDGRILFFEHVRVQQPFLARIQSAVTPLWKRLYDGCHLDRDTLSTIKKAGFSVDHVKEYKRGLFIVIEASNEDPHRSRQ
ncbi:SAM-dependent methyltransferase [Salipaludibacillus keqinensis]|uniref:SAM-dependent methyltransferase n=1 Tax=Salipaludibacillus keqinensis TaxID=2045207 RepID=A0A323TIL2_9BACI|nr:class I SAM-dependent methyltransferase [Salipaludibacillus keqinensis]PYZ93407.1 SAM-dependent methyltransferase [Salipaludibacillus keqinensis]